MICKRRAARGWSCVFFKHFTVFFQILRVLGESAIAVRTKAMKCLSEVVAVDPSILARVCVVLEIYLKIK